MAGCGVVVAACLSVGVGPAREARAGDAAEKEGRALFDEGVALGKQGRWAEACPKLAASLERFPGIGTRGKLAECYEKILAERVAKEERRNSLERTTNNGA